MNEVKASGLYKKGVNALNKMKYIKALDLLNESLSFNPEDIKTLNAKAATLLKLGRDEEGRQVYIEGSLRKLKISGDIISEINSIEAWIDSAMELKKSGDSQRAHEFLKHAALLSPIVDKKGKLFLHHNNPKLYYEMAQMAFHLDKNYDGSMLLFNKAINLDPSFTIPEGIKKDLNEYTSNRSGVGIKMIEPLNASNLRNIIPTNDKILVSTKGSFDGSYTNLGSNKTHYLRWESHFLICDNGIAFQGVKPQCGLPAYYIPWGGVYYLERRGRLASGQIIIETKAIETIKGVLSVKPLPDPQTNSFDYFEDLNLRAIWEEKQEELLRRTLINLKSFESIPKWKVYITQVEYIDKKKYKDIIKALKQDRT